MTAQAHAACPFSIAETYAVQYLGHAEAGAEIRVPLAFLPIVVARRVALTFGMHMDVVETGRAHDEIRLHWTTGTPLLPDFRGTVRFRIDGSGTVVLVEGSYRAPFGVLGRAFDALAGRHIAAASVRDLTRRLADHLEAREREWRTRTPS